MSTLRPKTVNQDSISDVTSSPTDDNAAPETCDKIMNTDESYLSNLSVRNESFIFKIVHYKTTLLLFRNIIFNR